jgi:hypothetical protein
VDTAEVADSVEAGLAAEVLGEAAEASEGSEEGVQVVAARAEAGSLLREPFHVDRKVATVRRPRANAEDGCMDRASVEKCLLGPVVSQVNAGPLQLCSGQARS